MNKSDFFLCGKSFKHGEGEGGIIMGAVAYKTPLKIQL